MGRLTNLRNSFINFDTELYLTQRECAIVKPFCLPIYDENDLKFQLQVNVAGIGGVQVEQTRIKLINNSEEFIVTGFTIQSLILGGGEYIFYFDFSTSNLVEEWANGLCYNINVQLYVTPEEGEPYYFNLGTSNQCFQKIPDICFTSKVTYYNNENAFGFYNYPTFVNVIRLPIYFKNPEFQNNQKVYVRSNTTRKKLFARLAKKWLGLIDMATEEIHQKLIVALSHDNVTFVTDNDYSLVCTFEDEYNQEFPNVMQGINVWTANFSVMETPFDEVNNNCN